MTEGKRQYCKQNSRLAMASVLLGVLGLLLFPASLHIYRPKLIWYPGYRYAWIPALIGLIISFVAISRIKEHGPMVSIKTAHVGLVLTAIVALLSILVPPRISYALRMVCGTHMASLSKAITSYAENNNGIYPDPNKWCDQLLERELAEPRFLLCVPDYKLQYLSFSYSNPKPDIGKCHYAMNVYCKPDSSPDTVLLFETTLGWNKHGGPELLTLENHDGDGCNIVFNDGHVAFEKRPLELNWGVSPNKALQSTR
jgi:prepilin-type processing-associated H-X9-DG protein